MLMSPMDLTRSYEPSVATMRKTEGETTAEPIICTALYDYDAVEKDELSFSIGDEIEVLPIEEANLEDPGWRIGRRVGDPERKVGMFPANFVTDGTVRDAVERQLAKPIIINFEELTFHDVIGAGGFGKVYKAVWKGEEVAVKAARFEGPIDSYDAENRPDKEVLREARLFSLLRHPNIVELFGVCLEAPNFCLVMELCHGGALSRLLEKTQLPANVVIDWALQIAQGMLYLHNDLGTAIIHRDLKSSNVLLSHEVHSHDVCTMSGNTLKISDFGLARQSNRTTHMSVAGTYAWMSPEVIRKSTFSKASDVWSFGVVLWELLTGEVPYRGMDGMAVFYGVATGQHRLPIPSTCPDVLKALMEECWAMEPKQRPLFEEIVPQLKSIAESAFASTDDDSFLAMQKVWQEEIQALFRELTEKEQELRTREDALQEEAVVHELQKQDLQRREEELAKRELDLLQREIAIITSNTSKASGPPAPTKRVKSKNGIRGFISKLGGRSDSQPQISKPSDFRHKMSVQRSPSPDRRESMPSSRNSSISRSPPGSPDNNHHHNPPAIRAITISTSLLRSAKSEMVLDPVGATDLDIEDRFRASTSLGSSKDPMTRFKSQTLPRNTKYYTGDNDSNSSQRTLTNENSTQCPGSASTAALVTHSIDVDEHRPSSANSAAPSSTGAKFKRSALGSLARLRTASPSARRDCRDIFTPPPDPQPQAKERLRKDSPTPKLARAVVVDTTSSNSSSDYLSPANDSGDDEKQHRKNRHSLPHLFTDASSPSVKRGFRNPGAIVGMSSAQAGATDPPAVSPGTPGSSGYSLSDNSQASCTSSPSVSPAPTPSALDNRVLRPQRHSTGTMMTSHSGMPSTPNTPPSLATASSHTSPLAGNCPSPCSSPTVIDNKSQRTSSTSIARPRPRVISTGALKTGPSSLPPPTATTRIHCASPASTPQSLANPPLATSPFPHHQSPPAHASNTFTHTPSHLSPAAPMLQPTSSPPPVYSSSPGVTPVSPHATSTTSPLQRPSSAGRRSLLEVNLLDLPSDGVDPRIALQPVSDTVPKYPSGLDLVKEFLN